ncbi:Hypothetical protein FKW44_009118, partial [Caligus rogercresseyi]
TMDSIKSYNSSCTNGKKCQGSGCRFKKSTEFPNGSIQRNGFILEANRSRFE